MPQMRSERSSFDDFVRANSQALARMAYLITWEESEAQDLTQECLLRVAKHWPRVSQMELPIAYARRILINLAISGHSARRRRLSELRITLGGESSVVERRRPSRDRGDDAFEALEVRTELLAALGAVPRQQRTVLMLRYYLDLSEAEIATVLGCSRGTVKSNAARGLDRLRELLSAPSGTEAVCHD